MATAGAILLVDDEDKILKTLGRALRADGHRVAEASSGQGARQLLAAQDFDLVILDNLMPDVSGLDLIREIVGAAPESERPQIVMMTAHATIERAIEAMKLGALDFLQKPFEIDELLVVASRAVEHQRLRTQHRYLINQLDEAFDHYGIVGRSKAMQAVIERAELVAETRSTVLITGETGTGKELVARAIHDRSAQRAMPLIRVNCAAIPDTLLESELFGHVRGAFTGAVANKKGRFALANGGTILLDEVATLGPPLQAKLLRVLQEREFEPLGSERTERVDVRVIAATNRDVRQLVAEGRFQEDLFYRLNVIPIEIPPLRERREDIPVLVEHFLRKHAQRTGKRIERVEEGVASAMQQYRLAGKRAGARKHGGAGCRVVARRHDLGPEHRDDRPAERAGRRTPLVGSAPEHRVGRARDDPPRAGSVRWRQEGRGRDHGHQPARPQLLPSEVPHRLNARPCYLSRNDLHAR